MGLLKTAVITGTIGIFFSLINYEHKLTYETDGHVEPGFELIQEIFK